MKHALNALTELARALTALALVLLLAAVLLVMLSTSEAVDIQSLIDWGTTTFLSEQSPPSALDNQTK